MAFGRKTVTFKDSAGFQIISDDRDDVEQQRARVALFSQKPKDNHAKKLSLFFATLCVIDLFGVFPIVALPRSIISCGLYGIPLVLLVITMQIYTATVLGRCWVIAEKIDPGIVDKNRYPYAAIAEFTYGRTMATFVTVLLDATVFGASIPNLLVASQNLQLLGLRITSGEFVFSFCYWLVLVGVFLCPIMWLGSPKNMRALSTFSVLICTSVAILTWFSIAKDNVTDEEFVPFKGLELGAPSWMRLLKAYGIIAFQFDINPVLLTIQVDMEKKRKIGKAVFLGLMSSCTLSTITTMLAAWRYGMDTTNNVLQILPKGWPLYSTILLVTLQLCLSSAVGNSALFQHIEEKLGASRDFSLKRCVVRSVLVWSAVLVAELLPRFDVVMGIIGGTLTGPLTFILPPLFYQKMTKLEQIYYQEMGRIQSRNATGDDPTDPLMPPSPYGAIERTTRSTTDDFARLCCQICPFLSSDRVLSSVIVGFGIGATLVSTYYNLFDVQDIGTLLGKSCASSIAIASDL